MPKPVWNGRKCLIWSCSRLLYFIKCCFLSQALRCKQPEARHSQKGTVPKPPSLMAPVSCAWQLNCKQSRLLWHSWSGAILMCFSRSQYHGCDFIKFSSNHPEKLCPGSAPAQHPSPHSLYLISCYSQELMQLHLTRPEQELPLLPQLPCTQGFHITELMIKGCPFYCLALPASSTFRWQHCPMGHHGCCCRHPGNWGGVSTPPWLLQENTS